MKCVHITVLKIIERQLDFVLEYASDAKSLLFDQDRQEFKCKRQK